MTYVTNTNRPTNLAPALAEWLDGLIRGAASAGDHEAASLADKALDGCERSLADLRDVFGDEVPA